MTLKRGKQRWYHGADAMMQGKRAFDSLLYTLFGAISTIIGRLALKILQDQPIQVIYIAFVLILIASYIVIAIVRFELYGVKNNGGEAKG